MSVDRVLQIYNTYKDDVKLQVVKPRFGSLYKIRPTKGKLHHKLQGSFTSLEEAGVAIRGYLKEDHEVPDTTKNLKDNVRNNLVNQEPVSLPDDKE